MSLSSPFINRPIATTLLSIGLALAGILAFNLLPTSALPEVEYPVILVQASLPGASPENMSSSVTTPLESALSSISAVTDITSGSTSGNSQIIMQFDLNRDINGAARDVQGAIDASAGYMPSTMTSKPTYRKVNPSDSPIIVLALSSGSYATEDIFDIASTTLQQKILKVEGVGQVVVVGGFLPAVRVSLDIDKMNQYGISLIDVNNVINNNNINTAKGVIDEAGNAYEIIANDQLFTAEEYGSLIVSSKNGNIVRLSDIADVKRSVQNVYNSGTLNGQTAVFLVVYKSPGANVVEANDRVNKAFFSMRNEVPVAIEMEVVLNRTTTIASSLQEVEVTLLWAMLFVEPLAKLQLC